MKLHPDSLVGRQAARFIALYGRLRADDGSTQVKRLLVTTMGGLGDGVLLGSIIQHLQLAAPTITIEVLADHGARAAIELLPGIQVFGSTRHSSGRISTVSTVRDLRRRDYDAVIASDHVAVRLAAMLVLARIPRRIGFAPLGPSPQARLYSHPIALNPDDSQWISLLRLARALRPELPHCAEVLPLPIAPAIEQRIDEFWPALINGEAALALHLGAGASYRSWPLERFISVAERLRRIEPTPVFMLVGAHADRELCREFIARYSGRVIDRSGSESLAETAALLRRCTLLVANDSGIMHLGAAMGVPTVALFGPNSASRWAPRGAPHRIVCGRAACSPCIDNYRGPAPPACVNPAPQECLRSITVDVVVDAVRDLLRR